MSKHSEGSFGDRRVENIASVDYGEGGLGTILPAVDAITSRIALRRSSS